MPEIRGLSRELQLALINLLILMRAVPDLDADADRRAQWLQWKLEGYDPAALAPSRP